MNQCVSAMYEIRSPIVRDGGDEVNERGNIKD